MASKADDDKKDPSQPQRGMSSQMQAVVRLLAGQEERTIAQKLADSNRPTWEQYKKDNEDKLNLEGLDQKKMDEYRMQLDAEREQLLARGKNHSKKKKKKRRRDYDDDSSDSDSYRHKHKKHKKKRKKKHRHRRGGGDDDDDSSDASSDSSTRERRRNSRKKKKKSKSKNRKDEDEDSDGSHYRLSKFFDQGDSGDE